MGEGECGRGEPGNEATSSAVFLYSAIATEYPPLWNCRSTLCTVDVQATYATQTKLGKQYAIWNFTVITRILSPNNHIVGLFSKEL